MALKLRDKVLASPAGSQRPLTRDEMYAIASSVGVDEIDLEGYCKYDEERYARNTVLLNEHIEVVVICWLPGQASAIHDHGRSNCLYLITEGEMREDLYNLDPKGKPKHTQARHFGRGCITIAAPTDVHRILNDTRDNLVTVHLYSPPLDESMTLYTPIPTRKRATA